MNNCCNISPVIYEGWHITTIWKLFALRRHDLGSKTSLTSPLFIEVPVPSQESDWSSVKDINFVSFYECSIVFRDCSDSVVFFYYRPKYKTKSTYSNKCTVIVTESKMVKTIR